MEQKDVHCFVDIGRDKPDLADMDVRSNDMRWEEFMERRYESEEFDANVQANTIKTQLTGFWVWNAKPINITKEQLQIGDFRFYKKKIKAGSRVFTKPGRKYNHVSLKNISSARRIIYGRKSSKRRIRWAVNILQKAVDKDSSTFAMYPLGMAYKNGKGEIKQDFRKAYKYFSEGADRGNFMCQYAKGYMLYKGLGCKQDYQEAAKALLKSANQNYPQAWYLLGLCCRNGYGLVQDSVAAHACINRARRMGKRDARDELARPHPETYMHKVYADKAKYPHIPDTMPDIRPGITDSIAGGSYRGFAVVYDYSGKYILKELPLTMYATTAAGRADGLMVIGTDSVSFAADGAAGTLKFSKSRVTLDERYARSGKDSYRLDSMVFNSCNGRIAGRLHLYSTSLKEPARPMYFELLSGNMQAGLLQRQADTDIPEKQNHHYPHH